MKHRSKRIAGWMAIVAVSGGLLAYGARAARESGPSAAESDAAEGAPKSARFPQITPEELNANQKPLAEEILKVSSIGLTGPYNLMLRSPDAGERMFRLLDYVRFHTSLPRRLNEFAILIQARLWMAQVEWTAHYPLALRAGLDPRVANDLRRGLRPRTMAPDESAVYDFCVELSTRHRVSDATFRRIRAVLNDQQIVDLITLSGTYTTVSMYLNAAQDDGAPGKLPPLAPLRRPLPAL